MGLVLDSSVLIASERKRQSIAELLSAIREHVNGEDILISAISVIELEHGLWRATTEEITKRRRAYLDEVFTVVPVYSFTKEMASVAARVDAEARKSGTVIPFSDLEIGATALFLGYRVVTLNTRHFTLIPGLALLTL